MCKGLRARRRPNTFRELKDSDSTVGAKLHSELHSDPAALLRNLGVVLRLIRMPSKGMIVSAAWSCWLQCGLVVGPSRWNKKMRQEAVVLLTR